MGRVLFWGIMLVIVGFAMLYVPWIILMGQPASDAAGEITKSFENVVNSEKICQSGAELDNAEQFCSTVNLLEKISYVVIGVGLILFLVGIAFKK